MPGTPVCHWCNKPKKSVQLITESKTHGICPDCLRRHFGLTVQQMYHAHAARDEALKFAKAEKRRKRREDKQRKAARGR